MRKNRTHDFPTVDININKNVDININSRCARLPTINIELYHSGDDVQVVSFLVAVILVLVFQAGVFGVFVFSCLY